MKRYLVFAGDFYYPEGGWEDFKASFDTKEEAMDFCFANKEIDGRDGYEWFHVVDSKTGQVGFSQV